MAEENQGDPIVFRVIRLVAEMLSLSVGHVKVLELLLHYFGFFHISGSSDSPRAVVRYVP